MFYIIVGLIVFLLCPSRRHSLSIVYICPQMVAGLNGLHGPSALPAVWEEFRPALDLAQTPDLGPLVWTVPQMTPFLNGKDVTSNPAQVSRGGYI